MLAENSERLIKEWWDSASEYYQKEISEDKMNTVQYGPFGSSEEKLKLLGKIKGKDILELGCGGGQVSIALAKKGAACTGIDISNKQIEFAVENAKKEGVKVEFIRLPFSHINKLKPRKFDVIISVMALQYCTDLRAILKNVLDLLVKNGIFVFSIEHPFYLLIDPKDMKIKESYFDSGLKIKKERWPDKSIHYFAYYDRKVSDIVNLILESGLKLERIIEPFDKEDRIWGRGYRRALINKIGPTIIFKCRK
ncbi:MAG: class I SAM-dependent methyltransferase [Candidatus Parvarchaeum sp.]